MSEARTDTADDRAHQPAALGAGGGKHRGSASSADQTDIPAHGKHRRPEDNG
ncbi:MULTISPECIES: hypothetical protein [Streptomycetaceae]|uniref:Uncharacterized protein n=1 Tax=Streptantibioticus cattleyicolor (strain ATCC 35852 / DSM 46488 / JCM 4925 / NBRC 14057 / NRRL 8057) TaxID=1003195 RepID=G8WWA8_STREN|nr:MULTISPECIES: hypothetical protein [Streptomycetaceae]AEW93764.1 hypothetical protein SCATT_13930 [Streptantibioticus cattleyicolor NRRL 8057 = DSM 46488]MYS58452.1 hypothetical protein [Streptomyces sp. SID5468]